MLLHLSSVEFISLPEVWTGSGNCRVPDRGGRFDRRAAVCCRAAGVGRVEDGTRHATTPVMPDGTPGHYYRPVLRER